MEVEFKNKIATFTCKVCSNLSSKVERVYKKLNEPICTTCLRKRASQNSREKTRQTLLKKYGVEHMS